MKINILSSQANSNLLMGLITDPEQKDVSINRDTLSNINKEIYDNFFTEFGNHCGIDIDNCSIDFDANRVTIDSVSSDPVQLDYQTLNEESKQIVDEFIILLETAE
jgi:hypothetical protein